MLANQDLASFGHLRLGIEQIGAVLRSAERLRRRGTSGRIGDGLGGPRRMSCVRVCRRGSDLCRRRIVSGVRVGRLVVGHRLLRRGVSGVGITRGLLRRRFRLGHHVSRVRIRRTGCRRRLAGRHGVTGVGICRGGPVLLLLGLRGRLAVALVLGKRGCRDRRRQHEHQNALHAGSPSIGRTLTTRIMPACMW